MIKALPVVLALVLLQVPFPGPSKPVPAPPGHDCVQYTGPDGKPVIVCD